jgi:hypothetical protein
MRDWIKDATRDSPPGALHRQLHAPLGKKIPTKTLNAAAKKPGLLGRRANLAKTLRSFHKKL